MYVYHYIYRYKILNFVFIGTILERVEFLVICYKYGNMTRGFPPLICIHLTSYKITDYP